MYIGLHKQERFSYIKLSTKTIFAPTLLMKHAIATDTNRTELRAFTPIHCLSIPTAARHGPRKQPVCK